MDQEWLFCTVIHFCALKPGREAMDMVMTRKIHAESIYRYPKSVRFHLVDEISLDTVKH